MSANKIIGIIGQVRRPELGEKITIGYFIENTPGDGSAAVRWYRTIEDAVKAEELEEVGWGDVTASTAQTYVGSDIFKEAIKNSIELAEQLNS